MSLCEPLCERRTADLDDMIFGGGLDGLDEVRERSVLGT